MRNRRFQTLEMQALYSVEQKQHNRFIAAVGWLRYHPAFLKSNRAFERTGSITRFFARLIPSFPGPEVTVLQHHDQNFVLIVSPGPGERSQLCDKEDRPIT